MIIYIIIFDRVEKWKSILVNPCSTPTKFLESSDMYLLSLILSTEQLGQYNVVYIHSTINHDFQQYISTSFMPQVKCSEPQSWSKAYLKMQKNTALMCRKLLSKDLESMNFTNMLHGTRFSTKTKPGPESKMPILLAFNYDYHKVELILIYSLFYVSLFSLIQLIHSKLRIRNMGVGSVQVSIALLTQN